MIACGDDRRRAHARLHELGAATPPFLGDWDPTAVATAPLLVAALLAGAVALAPRLLLAVGLPVAIRRWRRWRSAWRCGSPSPWHARDRAAVGGVRARHREAANEYLPALPALDLGLRFFLDRSPSSAPSLTVNASATRRGCCVTLHLLGIDDGRGDGRAPDRAGRAVACRSPTLLARRLLDERRARVATLLLAFSPSAMLYGATSADALYATLGAARPAAAARPARTWRARRPAALALASFFSWALLARRRVRGARGRAPRRRPRGARARGRLRRSRWLAFYGAAVPARTGYDPVGALRCGRGVYREGMASSAALRSSGRSARRSRSWSPLGLPITAWFALRALGSGNVPALALSP